MLRMEEICHADLFRDNEDKEEEEMKEEKEERVRRGRMRGSQDEAGRVVGR